jgi:hypothetical protein
MKILRCAWEFLEKDAGQNDLVFFAISADFIGPACTVPIIVTKTTDKSQAHVAQRIVSNAGVGALHVYSLFHEFRTLESVGKVNISRPIIPPS